MEKSRFTARLAVCLAGLMLSAGAVSAGEKKLMHCFAFTAIENASEADWNAFYQATDALPGKISGLTKVWYGKLRSPLMQFAPSSEAYKKLRAGEKSVTSEVRATPRQYGVCMEMNDAATLKTYTDNPEHKVWLKAYEKVRVAGTTTFDILGQ